MSTRQSVVKTVLWAIIGVWLVATLARFKGGLGATTGLSDAAPWGFWIAFDVMAGVALAAGGFVLAATVYIFRLEQYRPFARAAILTAFLGYAAVATGLLYDLGLPWRIWYPIISPQPRSALFEVAMCVMLYLTVLFLEFSPVALEHRLFDRPLFRSIHRGLKKATILLVIAGIVLSTLHQSSLGSLFLIAPYRLHPLWYTPIIWILFLVSAIGLGLMMVTLESFFSAWFFGHRLRIDLLSGLGKAASVVLFLYAALRITDLAMRGVLGMAFDGSAHALLFLFELSVSALIPATLLAMPRVRSSARGMAAAAVMTVLGMIGYRLDVCIVAFEQPPGMSYFPTWIELAVSLGIVAGALLLFIFFVENLKVYPDEHGEETAEATPRNLSKYNPASMWGVLPESLAAPRRYSLAVVLGAAVAMASVPADALLGGSQLKRTPVSSTRTVDGALHERAEMPGHDVDIVGPNDRLSTGVTRTPLMVIDGNRDGRLVMFLHERHIQALGDDKACAKCHHQNLPFQKNSACHQCHQDMYLQTDTFSHSSHVAKLQGNDSCTRCHKNGNEVKKRSTATRCIDCHADMVAEGSTVRLPEGGMTGYAAGYMDAMHGLCIECHQHKVKEDPHKYGKGFSDCLNCHRDGDESRLRRMAPYVTTPIEDTE